ncbi:MAG: TonB family protein [Acidobacteria bacterium]|nr:TonB family protein [Acidobacteriota bacterium]
MPGTTNPPFRRPPLVGPPEGNSAGIHTIPRRISGPRLGVVWESRRRAFVTNLRLAVGKNRLHLATGRAPAYFHDFWALSPRPWRNLLGGLALQFIIIYLPIFSWTPWRIPVTEAREESKKELTWLGSSKDLPLIAPIFPKPKPAARAHVQKVGADAYHPRQRIVATPPIPTHPRQLLIQPMAPMEAPKILPQLPNIVQWTEVRQPARPKLEVKSKPAPRALARYRKNQRLNDVELPQLADVPLTSPDVKIALNEPTVAKPRLQIAAPAPMRTSRRNATQSGDAGSAPDAGVAPPMEALQNGAGRNLIALSATPAPPAPDIIVPPGNLTARLSISPEGRQPGEPGGNGNGGAAAEGSGNGGGKGLNIPNVSITGGDPSKGSNMSGIGASGNGDASGTENAPSAPARRVLPIRPGRGTRPLDLRINPTRSEPLPALNMGVHPTPTGPEALLGQRQIYTLHVNMPNLTSASGSWILNFAEMDADKAGRLPPGAVANPLDLVGPVPLHKVDPRYPPALVAAKIEGEVVLFAIIRKDGSVDSIQLVRGIDPQLDENAMAALSRWKFRAAERAGKPIELEAVVRIPFRVMKPQ